MNNNELTDGEILLQNQMVLLQAQENLEILRHVFNGKGTKNEKGLIDFFLRNPQQAPEEIRTSSMFFYLFKEKDKNKKKIVEDNIGEEKKSTSVNVLEANPQPYQKDFEISLDQMKKVKETELLLGYFEDYTRYPQHASPLVKNTVTGWIKNPATAPEVIRTNTLFQELVNSQDAYLEK